MSKYFEKSPIFPHRRVARQSQLWSVLEPLSAHNDCSEVSNSHVAVRADRVGNNGMVVMLACGATRFAPTETMAATSIG